MKYLIKKGKLIFYESCIYWLRGNCKKNAEIIKKTYPSAQIFSVKEQLDSDSNSEVKQIDSKIFQIFI